MGRCTEYLWTYQFSDLYYLIRIINVLTQLLMSSIALTLLNDFG